MAINLTWTGTSSITKLNSIFNSTILSGVSISGHYLFCWKSWEGCAFRIDNGGILICSYNEEG
jgi:hypothetical protein